MNSSIFDETNTMNGWPQNSSSDNAGELESEWGIPHHPVRRALVCHAVFGPHHRFLRRACWFAGFVEVLPTSILEMRQTLVMSSLLARGAFLIIRFAVRWFAMLSSGRITAFCAEHAGGLVVESIPFGRQVEVCVPNT